MLFIFIGACPLPQTRYVVVYKNEWRQVKKNPANLKKAYRKKGRQDRGGIYEEWLMNRFEYADDEYADV